MIEPPHPACQREALRRFCPAKKSHYKK